MAMSTKKTDLLGRDVTNLGLGTGYKTSFVNKANTSNKKKRKKPTYSAAGIEVDPSYYATSGSGGSYSASGTRWYDVTKSDISGLLNAYEQQAASNRHAAENKYNTTRNDLLTALNFIPDGFGRYKLKRKKAVVDYIKPNEKYLARRKEATANMMMGQASTFTNEIEIDRSLLVNKRKRTTPMYIIKFNKFKDTWFTVWNDNIISDYNGEQKTIIPNNLIN